MEIESGWLKKKGSKFGFWHKRFCKIINGSITISRSALSRDIERTIAITPETRIEISAKERPPRFFIIPESDRSICLGSSSRDTVISWTASLRNMTMHTPGMSMDNFEIVRILGRGFYGKVMLCRKKGTDNMFAVKTVHKNKLLKANKVHTIFTERNVLLHARHPFIVNFAFAFQTDRKVYLGLEYASGGELFHHLRQRGRIPITEVKLYIAELALAIDYLHGCGVVYRDLKPENVLLDANGHIKLTDFGLSKELDAESTTSTFCGTSEYLAPEIIMKKPYTSKIDWWALGVLTYELLFGRSPFHDKNRAKMFSAIRNNRPRFPPNTDRIAIDFINGLLTKNPEARSDFSKLKVHPFFSHISFEDVLGGKVQPVFVPPVTGVAGNFDAEFTMENPQDSLATPVITPDGAFNGFSYTGQVDAGVEGSDNSEPLPGAEQRMANLQPTTM